MITITSTGKDSAMPVISGRPAFQTRTVHLLGAIHHVAVFPVNGPRGTIDVLTIRGTFAPIPSRVIRAQWPAVRRTS